MNFENFSILWNNIYNKIQLNVDLYGFKSHFQNFRILEYNDTDIIIHTNFINIFSIFNGSDIVKISNIIKNVLNINNINIKYQINYTPEITINKNSLNNIIVTSENRLIVKVANEICNNLTHNSHNLYSPLYLFATTGMGKSHIINGIILRYINTNLKYIHYTGETFNISYNEALKNNSLNKWKSYNNNCNLFIIEDIQLINKDCKAIYEFDLLLDNLIKSDNNTQIIITSNCPPNELSGFSDSLKSKLQWGIKLEIESLKNISSEIIIKEFSTRLNLNIPQNLITTISKSNNNIRELEGLIKTLNTYNKILNKDITIELIHKITNYKPKNIKKNIRPISNEDIIYNVCKYYNINEKDIKSKKRSRNIAHPRQIAMYITKYINNTSLQEIGKIYGGRDHSTVKHSNDKIKLSYKNDINIKKQIDSIIKLINNNELLIHNK